MRDAPRLRGGPFVRGVCLVAGLAVVAAAIVSLLESGLGLAPWDVLHQGIARHTPLTLGTASIVVGLVVLAFGWAMGATPGVGTVANAVLIGAFIDRFTAIGWVQGLSETALPGRVLLLALGIGLFGVGSALYIGAGFGAGPRDGLMLALARRSGRRIALVRGAIEVTALAAGIALGGTAGVGTIAMALLVGPSVEASFWALRRAGLAVERVTAEAEPFTPPVV
ncbi:MAG: YczE/YyaS/YitT family protein [Planctomycetaceae bacterium]